MRPRRRGCSEGSQRDCVRWGLALGGRLAGRGQKIHISCRSEVQSISASPSLFFTRCCPALCHLGELTDCSVAPISAQRCHTT